MTSQQSRISSSLLAAAILTVLPTLAQEVVSADTPRATPAGATFTVPAGWSIKQGDHIAVLTPPESDTHIAIVDSGASSAAAAVDAAWASYRPQGKHPLKLASPRPARNGWDERQVFDYETSPNERAVVEAIALRAGDKWTLVILDGTEPTFEKRAAPIGTIVQSLRPKGYQRESFAGRKAQALGPRQIAQMKSFVENSMKALGVPGVSVALVDSGKVVFEGGFGVKELGKPAPVDENTLFISRSRNFIRHSSLATRIPPSRSWSDTWCAPARVFPVRISNGSSKTRTPLRRHLSRSSGPCSRPANSARCFNTAI